jgi:methionyl aminopeptidase
MSIETPNDLAGMKKVGRVVADVLETMRQAIKPGLTTGELDEIAARRLAFHGARSAPRMTYQFPGYTCISVNEEIVHGIPGDRRIEAGDVVKIDVTAELDGYIADAARTVLVGEVTPLARQLRTSAIKALESALSVARAGERIGAIGRAVHAQATRDGFAIVRELSGHGVGRKIHEPPNVLNFDSGSREKLTFGLVIAIEPMLTARPARCVEGSDGWTIRTHNHALAAHEEHTVVITAGRPLVLTA